jgi:hypothetical protein
MLVSCLPRRKIICGFSPPRAAIQRRTAEGYIEYSNCVAPELVIVRPSPPKSHAAWKPRLARDVTQILSRGTAPRTMVHAEAHRPSIMTVSPEARRLSYLLTYAPIRPPRSSAIRTTAWLAPTPAKRRTAASSPVTYFIPRPSPNLTTKSDCK